MANFFRGLMCLVVGGIALVLARNANLNQAFWTGKNDGLLITVALIGFIVMTLGPVLFWAVLPIVGAWQRMVKRQEARRRGVSASGAAAGPSSLDY